MKTLYSILVLATIISCAPSLSYYTQNTHDSLVRDDSDPGKIQFYVSNDIILWREISKGESTISNGKIKMVNGREVEEVIIKRGTPGVYLFSPQKKQYAICFDPNDDSKYLIFGPLEKTGDRYVLLAKEWDRRKGKVTYGDKVYNTSAESAFAYLMASVTKTKNTRVSSDTPSGRKVQ